MWPDWAIFVSLCTIFSYKSSPNIWWHLTSNYICLNITFLVKPALTTRWVTFWKFGLLFIAISGHTGASSLTWSSDSLVFGDDSNFFVSLISDLEAVTTSSRLGVTIILKNSFLWSAESAASVSDISITKPDSHSCFNTSSRAIATRHLWHSCEQEYKAVWPDLCEISQILLLFKFFGNFSRGYI